MDKGYDARHVYEGCEDRDVRPIIPLTKSPGVKRGDHKTPTCEHGAWRFAGADYKRKATKWRCPTGDCKPASVWIKAERMFLDRVRLHADLTILAKLACTLAKARAVPLAA